LGADEHEVARTFGGDGVARWGDYSAAVAAEDGTVWTASEWIPGSFGFPPFLANWGTFFGNISPWPRHDCTGQ
jgi:hypothetical protein